MAGFRHNLSVPEKPPVRSVRIRPLDCRDLPGRLRSVSRLPLRIFSNLAPADSKMVLLKDFKPLAFVLPSSAECFVARIALLNQVTVGPELTSSSSAPGFWLLGFG